jgi:DNA-binding NarL/FixJ family response regulator
MGLIPRQEDVAAFVGAGASGFVLKNTALGDVLSTIRSVAQGVDVVPPQPMRSVVSRMALEAAPGKRPELLEALRFTSREWQVFDLAGAGWSNRDIARWLRMSIHDVKSHMQNLLEKLALRARLEDDAGASTRSAAVA